MKPSKKKKLEDAGWRVGDANEFLGLTPEERPADWKDGLPPITRSLAGRAKGQPVNEEDYHRHLEEKHLR